MESKHENQSSHHPRNEAEGIVVRELQPVPLFGNVENVEERGSSAESTCEDRDLIGSSTSSPDVSSFSSDSSSDEFIQVDPILTLKTADHAATPIARSTKEKESDVSSKALFKLEEYLRSSSSNSRISDVTIESFIPDASRQSPPIQVMERMEEFDPNRIPASIFGQPSSPLDWSAASNESLFSIHIGNYSFPRDHVVILGGDVDNSEEFSRPEECYSFRDMYNSGELISSDNFYKSKELKIPIELVKREENAAEAKDVQQMTQNFTSTKARVLEEALTNIPKRSNFKIQRECLEIEKANCRQGAGQSFTHSVEQRRCCCRISDCSCECLSCPCCCCSSWSGCSSGRCCRSDCSCKRLCWPNCCCKSHLCCCGPLTWPSCNCKCPTWWNCSCNCSTCPSCCDNRSICSSCCCSSLCSTSTWTCSMRKIFCCFCFQSSRNKQPRSRRASNPAHRKRCRCCSCC